MVIVPSKASDPAANPQIKVFILGVGRSRHSASAVMEMRRGRPPNAQEVTPATRMHRQAACAAGRNGLATSGSHRMIRLAQESAHRTVGRDVTCDLARRQWWGRTSTKPRSTVEQAADGRPPWAGRRIGRQRHVRLIRWPPPAENARNGQGLAPPSGARMRDAAFPRRS